MVDGAAAPGAPEGPPPVKRKRGRPRKADVLAAAAAAAAAAPAAAPGAIVSTVNGVPPAATIAVKPEPKQRKSRKKGEVTGPVGVDMNLVGKAVTGVLDGSFDAGYLLTVRVGDSDSVLRGVVFGPGLTVPLSKSNDVAPGIKVVKRDENVPLPASSPISVLGASGANAVAGFTSQGPPAIHPPAATTAAGAKAPSTGQPTVSVDPNSQVGRGQDSAQTYVAALPAGTAAS